MDSFQYIWKEFWTIKILKKLDSFNEKKENMKNKRDKKNYNA